MTMNASYNLIDKIREFEGCKLYAYRDAKGVLTIGVGHTKGVKAGQAITMAQAEEYLREDLAESVRYVNSLKLELTQDEFDALVDFAFNCGSGNLGKSTLLKYVRHHSTDLLIIREFMKWVRSGGRVLKGLVARRKWEAETYIGKEIYQDEQTLKWFVKKS